MWIRKHSLFTLFTEYIQLEEVIFCRDETPGLYISDLVRCGWYMPIFLTLRRMRQEDCELEDSLGHRRENLEVVLLRPCKIQSPFSPEYTLLSQVKNNSLLFSSHLSSFFLFFLSAFPSSLFLAFYFVYPFVYS